MGSTGQYSENTRRALQYGLPTLSVLIMSWQPAATQLVFVFTAVWAYAQSYLLSSNQFRSWAGIQPLAPKGQRGQTSDAAYKGTITMHKSPSGSYTANNSGAGSSEPEGVFAKASKFFQDGKVKAVGYSKARQQKKIEEARKRRAQQYEARRKEEINRSRKN